MLFQNYKLYFTTFGLFCSFALHGGQSLLEGGEYLVQALNAVTCNVITLAQSLDDKLTKLDDDVHR